MVLMLYSYSKTIDRSLLTGSFNFSKNILCAGLEILKTSNDAEPNGCIEATINFIFGK